MGGNANSHPTSASDKAISRSSQQTPSLSLPGPGPGSWDPWFGVVRAEEQGSHGVGGRRLRPRPHHLTLGPERALGVAEPMWSKPLLLDRRPVGAWLCCLSPRPAPLPGVPFLPSLSPSHRLPARPRPAFASRKSSGASYHPLPPQLQDPKAGQARSPAGPGGGSWTARRPGQGAGQQASHAEARLSSLSPKDTAEEHPWTPNTRASWGTSTTLPGHRPTGSAGSPKVGAPHLPSGLWGETSRSKGR